jgi:hypothetical protein
MSKTALISHVPVKGVPFDYHVYLLGNYAGRYHNTTVINVDDNRYQAGFIAKDMFKRGIKKITASPDEKHLIDKIHELHKMDGLFNIHAGPICMNNIWHNIPHIKTIINSYKGIYKDKPAIIVSAGPSLNKNIHVLKTLQNKAVIIAAGSAIMTLKAHGIVPHYLCSIDPNPVNAENTLPYVDNRTTLIADCQVYPGVVEKFPGDIVFYASEFDKELVPDLNYLDELQTNATVTTTSLNLAVHFGCDPVVLVGQDMCYSGDSTHADSREQSKIHDLEFEDIHGNKVKSSLGFKEVFDYFNSVVPNLTCHVINATEGGAGVKCADVMTLVDVSGMLTDNVDIVDVNGMHEVNIDHKVMMNNIDNILMRLKGFKKRNKGNIVEWIAKLGNEPIYQYVKKYMDWIIWEVDDNEKILSELEKTLKKLRGLVNQ